MSSEDRAGGAVTDGDGATTVLVVDDEAVVRESFSLYLEPLGYEVETAADAQSALEAFDESVDVVLLDRRIPGPSGDEVLAEIRGSGVQCRVALVTAVDPDFDVVELDCDDYLVKPVDKSDLIETVERLELLGEYSEAQRELSSLRVKRNVLEVEKNEDALADSEEFRRLEARIDELEAELDELEDAFESKLGFRESG